MSKTDFYRKYLKDIWGMQLSEIENENGCSAAIYLNSPKDSVVFASCDSLEESVFLAVFDFLLYNSESEDTIQ